MYTRLNLKGEHSTCIVTTMCVSNISQLHILVYFNLKNKCNYTALKSLQRNQAARAPKKTNTSIFTFTKEIKQLATLLQSFLMYLTIQFLCKKPQTTYGCSHAL